MATTLADIRTKYPQYKDVDDQRLADALYKKYYSHAERREFDARVGLKPYQGPLEAAATAVGNLPADIAGSKYGIGRGFFEGVREVVDPTIQTERTPTLAEINTPGAPIKDMLNAPAAETSRGLSLGALLPEDVKLAIAKPAAMGALGQQLRAQEAERSKQLVDVAPGSLEDIAAQTAAGVTDMAAPAVASLVLRNPGPMVAYFTARSAGSGYQQAREQGAGVGDAQLAAGLYAAAETATEALAGKVFVDGAKTIIGTILKNAATEGLTEGATEAIQALVDTGVVGVDMTLDEALTRIRTAATVGAAAGGSVAAVTAPLRRKDEPEPAAPPVEAAAVAPTVEPDAPIENQMALPAPGIPLALPSPEDFAPPAQPRRQGPAPARAEPASPTSDELEYQVRVALQRSRQAETRELLDTARETITPLGTFSAEEVGGPAAQRVNQLRVQTGRSLDAPITIAELARAKVPQDRINAIIAARRPKTSVEPLSAEDVLRTAAERNIVATDEAFKELALRTTGARDINRMTQTQLNALRSVVEAMPAHKAPISVPLADLPGFTEDQYGKAVDAVRTAGRYTHKALKDTTGLRNDKDVKELREAMVRRGQLVQRGPNDFRLYDVLGAERKATPDEVPQGVMRDYAVRRIPVSKVRVRQGGKSVGVFDSATAAREQVSAIRSKEEGAPKSAVAIEPAEEVAWGVIENRYDAEGNLVGQVVVQSSRDEAAMRRAADEMSAPEIAPEAHTRTLRSPPKAEVERAPAATEAPRRAVPAALDGRVEEVASALNTMARQRGLPLLGAKVALRSQVTTPDGRQIEGMYFNKLLSLSVANLDASMSTQQVVDRLAQIMDHELIHALREAQVLAPGTEGWKTLSNYVRKAKRPDTRETYLEWAERNYANERGYENPDTRVEEAIAEAFRHWASNRRNVVGKPATVFSQLAEWFKRLIGAVPEDVFSAIETGKLVEDALRPPGASEPRARATRTMQEASAVATVAKAAGDEPGVRRASREYLRARTQAREDRYGRSGPKTVLGTTPASSYETGALMDRAAVGTIAERYRQKAGIKGGRLMTLLPVDETYMQRVADVQQKAGHNPDSTGVAKAYRALIDETRAMWQELGDVKVTAFTGDGSPYASRGAMFADLSAGRLQLRLSADMFGAGADNPGHPLNAAAGIKTVDGQDLTWNDVLRVVHDVYGHGQSGFNDSPLGRYNAYHEHARLLSPEARRALATETLAQGAWDNFGPHMRRKDGTVPGQTDVDYLPPNQREFAQQKAFLLPDPLVAADPGWALADAASAAEASPRYMVGYHGTPHKVDKFSSSKIGTGEGAQAFGHGLYFAGKREIAEHYRRALSYKSTVKEFRDALPDDADVSDVMELVGTGHFTPYQDRILKALEADGWLGFDYPSQAISAAFSKNVANWDPSQELLDAVAGSGNLYKVDIPEDNELLDWDSNVTSQPPAVRAALTQVVKSLPGTRANPSAADMLASNFPVNAIYDAVANALGGPSRASEAFRAAGIPGHRYEDASSRGPGKWVAAHPDDVPGTPKGKWPLINVRNNSAAPQFFDSEAAADAEAKRLNADRTYNYVVYDDSRIQILEENPKFSKFDDALPGGRLYGNPARSPGGVLSKPDTSSPVLTEPLPSARYFGGEMVDEQLRMAREGERGAVLVYMNADDFLAVSSRAVNPEQDVYDAASAEGYKFSTMPSLVIDGYAGNVRATESDGAFIARALAGRPDASTLPVMLYPKRPDGLGLVTAIEANNTRVPLPHGGFKEFDPDLRGARYSVGVGGNPAFKRWFGDSKVIDEAGAPLVVYRGDRLGKTAFYGQDGSRIQGNVFFSSSKSVGEKYAKGGQLYSTYLALENPLEVNADGASWSHVPAPRALKDEWFNEDLTIQIDELAEWARKQGYDGLIVRDVMDQYGDGDQYVAFEPTQIKSVDNRGTFDPADARIRYSINAAPGERVPNTPPRPMFNIVRQRTETAVGKFLHNLGRSKREVLPLPIGFKSVFDARVKLQDRMLSVKEMIEDIGERGGNLDDTNDTYMLEQLYHGKVFDQIRQREETLQLPLLEALKRAYDGPNKVTPKDFEDYLYALHAPERNAYLRARGSTLDNPSGMTDAEATAILDRLALEGKLPDLNGLERMARAITANTTATRIEGGLISPDTESPFKHYVPLRGFAEEDLDPDQPSGNQTRARSGKGFGVGGREDRSMTGRERKAGDILGHLFLQNTEAVIRAEKNQVALSFMKLLQDNPDIGYGTVLKSAPTRRVVGPNGMIHEAGDPTYRQQPDIVTAKYKGREIVARVTDERVARAIKSDYVSSSNDLVNALGAVAGRINRYLATVNTAWNPEFMISNLARDAQTAAILGQQYDIPKLARKIIGDAPAAMAGIRAVLRDGNTSGPWAATFREMQEAGGTTEFLGIQDLESQVRRIRRSVTKTGLATTPRKIADYLGQVGKFVDDYNKVAENAFRLAAYKAARDAGTSVPQAAYLAKNLTVNFNKGGEMKGAMNAAYLFYNASVQGSFVLMNGLRSKRVQKLVAGVVMAGLLQDMLNRALSGDDDENGVPDYDDVPDYVLETNFVLMDPFGLLKSMGVEKGYFAFPMPYGFNAFYNLGRNMSAGFSGSPVHNPGKAVASSLLTFLDAFNPLGGAQDILNFIAPTLVDPLVDVVRNKDYAGNDIVPERPSFGVPVPESQKYWSNTSDIPRDVAAQLNALTGGNEVRPGTVDISPEILQYGFDYATGALGKFVQRLGTLTLDTGPKALQGDFADIEIGDIPFARRLVGSVNSRAATERYYAIAEEIGYVAKEMELAQETGDVAAGRKLFETKRAEVELIDTFEGVNKTLSDLRKQLRDLRENEAVPDARKREIELKLRAEQDRLMARLTALYFTRKRLAGTQ